jgi:hypothetical protein
MALSQSIENDARLWFQFKLDKDVHKKLNVHIAFQNRINENMSRFSRSMSEMGLTFKIHKNIRLLVDYSFGFNRRLDDSYSKLHRMDAGLLLRKKVKKLVISSRNLIQWQYKNVFSSENGKLANIYFRSKLSFNYQLNKHFECYTAQEINLALQSLNEEGLSRSRTFFGLTYNLNKKNSIETYFLYQKRIKTSISPRQDFVYGIKYSKSL